MPINVSGFTQPVYDFSGIDRAAAITERKNEFEAQKNYQLAKDKEADEWRKLKLIQDLTDLSTHQTGSDVANAIGNQHATKIFQKYTQAASTLSPSELQYNIQKDMSGLTSSMDAIKNELDVSDKQIAAIKQQYPGLDVAKLAKDYRSDILHRRLKSDTELANPIEVQPTQMKLDDPEFLSDYVTGDKNLRTYFTNPQGMDEMSVYKGTPNNYTKYTAKVPSYKKPNFDPANLQAGFLTTKDEPKLSFKSSVLPSDALPSSKNQPFEMMDDDVYKGVTGQEKIELVRATKDKFKNYSSFTPTEKEYAQRNVLLEKAKAFDQTGFHPTEVHTPSAALLKLNMGQNGANGSTTINNVYDEIEAQLSNNEKNGKPFIKANELNSDAMSLLTSEAQKNGKSIDDKDITSGDVVVMREGDRIGYFVLYDNGTNKRIGYLTHKSVNIKTQPGAKEKREVVKKGNDTEQTYNHNGKTYTQSQIEKGAKFYNLSVAEYLKQLGIK